MSSKPFADSMIGKTVAQYQIVAKLGGGGMGIVYQAKDTRLGRLVALKFLPPQWSHDENAKQRFVREAQAASATDHAHICTIHDISSTDDGQLFIVMAFYGGQTLKQRLESGGVGLGAAGPGLEADESLRIAGQVAEGLAKAHAQGVVHRDIKPGNLMLTDDGVKILDFGLAKFVDSLQLTIVGTTLGTVAYMSPEQARGEEADARSDIWAVGVVLYEMLTGELPFKGAYPEAISHAIRNEAPAPIAGRKAGITGDVEKLVFRALAKDPADRYQSARELARDLRLLQGFTVPFDLRTEQLPPLSLSPASSRRSRARTAIMAAAAAVLFGGVALWLTRPIVRIPVTVAAVVNQTGYPELDPYRLALTHTLSSELAESPSVRVVPYERWLQIVRRFVSGGADVSSRDAVQALTSDTGTRFVVVPTLVYENNAWRARGEIRNTQTATNVTVYETEPVVSSLTKDTALGLMASLADGVERYFTSLGPIRLRLIESARSVAGHGKAPAASALRSLDAAAAFEQGMNAYEQLEYAAARKAFSSAGALDPGSPLPLAWLSRVCVLMRQDDDAVKAGDQAVTLLTVRTSKSERLFVEAVSAESRRDGMTADVRYRALVAMHPDEPMWLAELAAFQDRRAQTAEAIATYRRALGIDGGLVRPRLELCRLYNRLNESADAKLEGQAALLGSRAIGNRGGEAQALMCLADRLRLGTDEERAEAGRDARAALKILEESGSDFNVARARYYVALTTAAAGDLSGAAALWEQSLMQARELGNRALESLDLMNLGGASTLLGRRGPAMEFYRQGQSAFEALGDERRAAEQRANAAAILIEYSDKPDEGMRDMQNALGVFRKLGDRTFEVFAAKLIGESYWYSGRHAEGERELNRAVSLTKQWNLDDRRAPLTLELARSKFDMGAYGAALDLAGSSADGSSAIAADARILMARIYARLGAVNEARAELAQVQQDSIAGGNPALAPALHTALGEVAYEAGSRAEARAHFQQAAALWTDALPDVASVEARSYVGLLDALDGNSAAGGRAALASLDQARRMRRFSLEAWCRVRLARIDIGQRAYGQAVDTLKDVVFEDQRPLGAELQAQVRYWRSQALRGLDQPTGAAAEEAMARKLAGEARESQSTQYREKFAARPDIEKLFH